MRGSATVAEPIVFPQDSCLFSLSILSILHEIPRPCMPVSKQPLHDMHLALAVFPLFHRLIKFGSRIKGLAREM